MELTLIPTYLIVWILNSYPKVNSYPEKLIPTYLIVEILTNLKPREMGPAGREMGSAGRDMGPAGREMGSAGHQMGPAGREMGPAGRETGSAGRWAAAGDFFNLRISTAPCTNGKNEKWLYSPRQAKNSFERLIPTYLILKSLIPTYLILKSLILSVKGGGN